MMLVAVFERPDGELWVVVPVPSDPRREGESEAEHIERIAAHAVAGDPLLQEFKPIAHVDASALPARRWRNCWRIAAAKVAVDLPLARQQVLAETRRERNKRLTESDSDKARLDDIGTPEQRAAIAKHRQELRDLPAKVSEDIAAMDLAALESYRPQFPAKVA